jgi:general nucleoside transport system ATP-binding protein
MMTTDMKKADVPLIQMQHICKSFLGNRANDNISIHVDRGEICALLGENGAGKSTLMNILFGLYGQDSGSILINGKSVSFASPGDAIKEGIGMIHQHFTLIPGLSVLKNLMTGPYGHTGFLLNFQKARKDVRKLMDKYHFDIDPDALVGSLSIGEKQKVEILKALYRGAELLIMDEPTAVLSPAEAESLFSTLHSLVNDGLAIILISHKMKEIIGVTDRVYVLRRGKLIAELNTGETSAEELAALMIGKAQNDAPVFEPASEDIQKKNAVLHISGLCAVSCTGAKRLDFLCLDAAGGEILGIAGVSGNGQTELCDILFGLSVPEKGSVVVNGKSMAFGRPWEVIQLGMARIPEDRIGTGLLMELSVGENILLGRQRDSEFCSPRGILNRKAITRSADVLMNEFDIYPRSSRGVVRSLSGGNLQKVILARELERTPVLVVASQPTRGLDIGAAAFIYRRLTAEKQRGAAVLVISDDLDELFAVSDRIAVISGGKIIGEQSRSSFDRNRIGLWISGVA